MQNVGTYDAIFRIAAGSLILSWASSKTKWSTGTSLLAAWGGAMLAEGVTRHCILSGILGLTTVPDDGDKTVLNLGPVVYRRISRPQTRSLWGVRSEADGEELNYQAPAAVETSGWNWEGQQPENDLS